MRSRIRYEITYQFPKKDYTGQVVVPPSYRKIAYPKTVYDPNVFSDDQMYRLGLEAMANGKLLPSGDMIEGYASNGLKFKGYYKDGEVTNFYPVLD